MEYRLIRDYKNDAGLRTSFNELAGLIFGIDFEKWFRLGFWNDRYLCYSYECCGKVVANVSANLLDIIIGGKRTNAVQIGTVMTHPDHRRKGLAEKLMNVVLEEFEKKSDLVFLFGNYSAEGFYARFGFDRAAETGFHTTLSTEGVQRLDSRKLDLGREQDVELLRRLSLNRRPLSSVFGVDRAEGILHWHCLNVFPQDLFYIEALDALVILRAKGETVELYDIISRKREDLCKIVAAVLPEGTYRINFYFTPEFGDIRVSAEPYKAEEYIFYVKSKQVRLTGEFFYPYTAHA